MPKLTIDPYDLKILDALQEDALISNVALSERIALSPSPCLRRVRRLKEAGVIQSILTVVSPEAVGYDIQGLIQVRTKRYGEDEPVPFEIEVVKMPEVLSCYETSGATDYIVHAVARNMPSYSKLARKIGGIEGVMDLQSSIVGQTIKPWSALPLKQLGDDPDQSQK